MPQVSNWAAPARSSKDPCKLKVAGTAGSFGPSASLYWRKSAPAGFAEGSWHGENRKAQTLGIRIPKSPREAQEFSTAFPLPLESQHFSSITSSFSILTETPRVHHLRVW